MSPVSGSAMVPNGFFCFHNVASSQHFPLLSDFLSEQKSVFENAKQLWVVGVRFGEGAPGELRRWEKPASEYNAMFSEIDNGDSDFFEMYRHLVHIASRKGMLR